MSDMATPTDADQARIHALNVQGSFFQRRCAHEINNTPDWRVLTQEKPLRYSEKESNTDIIATAGSTSGAGHRHILTICECKKADPSFKEWAFLRGQIEEDPFPGPWAISLQLSQFVKGPASVEPQHFQPAGRLLKVRDTNRPLTWVGYELVGDYTKKNSWKSANKRIQEAAYQVCLTADKHFTYVIL